MGENGEHEDGDEGKKVKDDASPNRFNRDLREA